MLRQKIFEQLRVDLFAVIYCELLWDAEPAYDVLPKKFPNCLGGDFYQGFSFDPFGEVFNGYHCILVISLGCRQRAYEVHSPPLERPGGDYQLQAFRRFVGFWAQLLASFARLDYFLCIF